MHVHEAFRGFNTDHPDALEIRANIGSLIVNAGGIELMVDLLLVALSPNPVTVADVRDDEAFAARKTRLVRYARASATLDPGTRTALIDVLDGVAELMKVRNEIAHGPVILHHGNGESAPPTAVGLLKIRGDLTSGLRIFPIDDIKKMVNFAHQGATLLAGLHEDVVAGRSTPAT